jgi:hypothetical protein
MYIVPFLIFLWLLSFHQGKESDKAGDITWLKDKSLADLDNLPDPDILAEEIAENLESALESFREVLRRLNG